MIGRIAITAGMLITVAGMILITWRAIAVDETWAHTLETLVFGGMLIGIGLWILTIGINEESRR